MGLIIIMNDNNDKGETLQSNQNDKSNCKIENSVNINNSDRKDTVEPHISITEQDRDSAAKSIKIAEKAIINKNFEKAERFLLKAIRFCPSLKLNDLLNSVREDKEKSTQSFEKDKINHKVDENLDANNHSGNKVDVSNDHVTEADRESASRSVKIAEEAIRQENFVKAERFLSKASRMNPNLNLNDLLNAVCEGKVRKELAPAIGIDLGTKNICIAVYRNGKVEIIPNEEGKRLTPSYVAFTDSDRLIGDAAKKQRETNPTNTIYDSKRLIGRKFHDPTVQSDIRNWPFEVINHDGKPKIKVKYKGEETTVFPGEVSSMLLEKVKEIAEAYFGKSVKNVVVTVPAYFNDSQRLVTEGAAALAGLNILKIMDEPAAAALAYGLKSESEESHNIAVIDLNGDHLNVSIVTNKRGVGEVKYTSKDAQFAGVDFDNRIVEHCVEEFKKQHGKDLRTSKLALRRLRTACKHAIRLTLTSNQGNINLENLFDGIDFHTVVTRPQFENLNVDLFKSVVENIRIALEDAGMSESDVNDVVLVGDGTRFQMMQSFLKIFFSGIKLNKNIDPNEVIAHGAALQAAMLEQASVET